MEENAPWCGLSQTDHDIFSPTMVLGKWMPFVPGMRAKGNATAVNEGEKQGNRPCCGVIPHIGDMMSGIFP